MKRQSFRRQRRWITCGFTERMGNRAESFNHEHTKNAGPAIMATLRPIDPVQIFFSASFSRFQASSRAFLLFSLVLAGSSPARLKPWPAPAQNFGAYPLAASFLHPSRVL